MAVPPLGIVLVADTGSSSSDKITSNPAVKGVGQANTLVTIKEGGATLGTAMADGTGAWSFTPVRLDRRRAHADRQPDRPRRQYRDGDAELHARQGGAGGEHGAGLGHRRLVDRQDYLQPGGQGCRSGQHPGHHQGGRRHARHDDGGRHRSLELHAGRSGRRRARTQRQPDRPRRQHRNGDAELYARQARRRAGERWRWFPTPAARRPTRSPRTRRSRAPVRPIPWSPSRRAAPRSAP